jgi:hypothetical protein
LPLLDVGQFRQALQGGFDSGFPSQRGAGFSRCFGPRFCARVVVDLLLERRHPFAGRFQKTLQFPFPPK